MQARWRHSQPNHLMVRKVLVLQIFQTVSPREHASRAQGPALPAWRSARPAPPAGSGESTPQEPWVGGWLPRVP